jgi:hypothetical protein
MAAIGPFTPFAPISINHQYANVRKTGLIFRSFTIAFHDNIAFRFGVVTSTESCLCSVTTFGPIGKFGPTVHYNNNVARIRRAIDFFESKSITTSSIGVSASSIA